MHDRGEHEGDAWMDAPPRKLNRFIVLPPLRP